MLLSCYHNHKKWKKDWVRICFGVKQTRDSSDTSDSSWNHVINFFGVWCSTTSEVPCTFSRVSMHEPQTLRTHTAWSQRDQPWTKRKFFFPVLPDVLVRTWTFHTHGKKTTKHYNNSNVAAVCVWSVWLISWWDNELFFPLTVCLKADGGRSKWMTSADSCSAFTDRQRCDSQDRRGLATLGENHKQSYDSRVKWCCW